MAPGLRISHGREAEVYAWGGDAVLKLYRSGFGGHVAEASVLAALDGLGVAPALAGTAEIDGRHGLILERLHGTDMLALLQRAPWRMLELAKTLAENVHAAARLTEGIEAEQRTLITFLNAAKRRASVDHSRLCWRPR